MSTECDLEMILGYWDDLEVENINLALYPVFAVWSKIRDTNFNMELVLVIEFGSVYILGC